MSGTQTAAANGATSTLVCTDGVVAADNAIEFNLEARDGYIEFPDGNTVYVWSYAEVGEPFQFPGPNLCVDEGDQVRVNFTNPDHAPVGQPANLAGGIPTYLTSITFPGQVDVTATGGQAGLFTNEIGQGGGTETAVYEFTASNPGTFMYQSGTDPAVQVQMGMFGGIVVYPAAGRHLAYPGHEFDPDSEYLLLFHEMDPNLHTEVELAAWTTSTDDPNIPGNVLADYDPSTRHNRYWTINGRSFPDTAAENFMPLLPNQPYGSLVQINADDPDDGYDQLPALVRYGNAGLDNHPFHPHGDTLVLIGRDGRQLPEEIEAYTETVAAGQTYEILAGWEDVEAWQGSGPPAAINVPILPNLVFKDGVTFYSGSADLGHTQQMPADVTSFSVCGEYYFPWHSHALQEVQNFDEGFGGMLTVWKVDPPKVFDGLNWVSPPECG